MFKGFNPIYEVYKIIITFSVFADNGGLGDREIALYAMLEGILPFMK
jgi:hypothetical protein